MSSAHRFVRPILILFLVLLGAACGSGASIPAGGGGAPAPVAPGGEQGEEPGAGGDGGGDQVAGDDQLIVRTGTLTLRVGSVEEVLPRARSVVDALGGHISASEEYTSSGVRFASITYRIPSERWDTALDQLKGLAEEVVREETDAVEVTGEVRDLDARIRNLRASESALVAILTRAERIPDVLEVQRELTTVREEIERLDTARQHLADQASMGTLTVVFQAPPAVAAEAARGWDPATEIDRAAGAVVQLVQSLATLVIWLAIVGLPLLGIGVALFWVVRVLLGRMEQRNRRPAPAPPAPPAEPVSG